MFVLTLQINGKSVFTVYFYRAALNVEVISDAEEFKSEQPEYVEVVDPFAPEISFLKSECPQRKVIKVICDQLGKDIFILAY